MAEHLKDRISQRLEALDKTARSASIEAGLSPDTLGKVMSGKTRSLRGDNLVRIARVLKVSESWLQDAANEEYPIPGTRPEGMSEPEVVPLAPPSPEAAQELGPNRHDWKLTPAFAGLAGYRAGDCLRVEIGLQPKDGDDVLAQVEDMQGGATTHLRHYRKNWLFGPAGTDPEFVDGVRVRIAAVVLKSWRERAGN